MAFAAFAPQVLSGPSVIEQQTIEQQTIEQQTIEDQLSAEARLIVKQFAGQLKPTLQAAIQSGGLVHAIDVCAIEAPKIAGDLIEQTGWNIKRVNLKTRNSTSAVADEFERGVLEQFDERQRRGELASGISFSRLTSEQFRFMSAQGVGGLCLNCHGVELQSDVKKALEAKYPGDAATGYSLGQIRGAFSLGKNL